VAVVRRGRQEQPMLEQRRQLADGGGEPAVSGIAAAAGWCCLMRFVKNEQGARARLAARGAQVGGI
jgi:hypothetical protein